MAEERCSQACYCHTHIHTQWVRQVSEWVLRFGASEGERKRSETRGALLRSSPGDGAAFGLFRCEEGCVASPSRTHRYMILPLVSHPDMPHFTWTPSCQNINALISSTQTHVFIAKDIIWHRFKREHSPKNEKTVIIFLTMSFQMCTTYSVEHKRWYFE